MPTIYDVAKKSGYSPTVVSHVLNNNPRVSEKAKAIILATVRQLGYKANLAARELGLKKTRLIGIIVRDIIYPFFPSIVESIEETAFRHGYTTILCNSAGNLAREATYVDVLTRRKVAGIIATPVQAEKNNSRLFLELKRTGVPIVFVDRNLPKVDTDYVITDGLKGGYEATKYLIQLGHTRIGCIEPSSEVTTRVNGYKKALEESGIQFQENLIARRKPVAEERGKIGNEIDGYEGAKQLLQMHERPTAIFATNDVMAFGAERAIREAHLRIPQDISLVGFDDVRFSSFLGVPLTTVKQPTHEIGQTAATLLISRIEQDNWRRRISRIILEPRLVIRESSGPFRTRKKLT